MTRPLKSAVICSALLLWSAAVYGQAVRGGLVGTISDTSGAAIPAAKIVITETSTGVSRSTETNASGVYVFADLPGGAYRVTVEHPGFSRAVRDGVDVLVNSTVRVDVALQLGGITETVNVVADIATLQTDRADTGRQLAQQQVSDLPLGYNRNFQSLLNLVPGASRAFRPHSEFYNSQDSLSTRVDGQARMANNIQFEGVDNNRRNNLLTGLIPPNEALETVDVTTSNYEAELGRAGGAVVNVILKSGSNEFHGSAYELNRVSRLAARNFFATSKAPTVYNMLGATLGGPIRKNRTFFFLDYQGIRDRRGDVFFVTIPTPDFRTGNFGAGPTTIYDPNTGDSSGRGRTPFLGNTIPGNRISPVAQRILALVPAPLLPGFGNNYQQSTVRSKGTDDFDIKVDHQASGNDRLSARYSFQRYNIADPPLFGLAGGGGKSFAGTGLQRLQSSGINYTHIFSPTLISEARVGFMRLRNDAVNPDLDTRASDQIGIPGVNICSICGGLATVNINGYSAPMVGYSASLPWQVAETNFNIVDTWTKTLGNHTIKWGVDIRRVRDDLLQIDTFGARGFFTFNPGPTALNGGPTPGFANAFASLLLDLPNQTGRQLPVIFTGLRQTSLFTYAQDKWQVRPKLTLDIGLRWEYWPPATPARPGGFSNYDPATNSLIIAGVGNNPSNMGRKTFYRDFAPRFGLAYRLSPKTVLRGGYGITYIPYSNDKYAYNLPARQYWQYDALNSYNAAGSMAAGFPTPPVVPIPADGIVRNAPVNAYIVVPLDYHEAYVQSWNLAIQRALPKQFTFEAAYVGNHGVRINCNPNINAGLVPGAGAAGQPLYQKFGTTANVSLYYAPCGSNYHSLQMKFDRRFAGNFTMTTAYTFSKSMDQMSQDNGILPNLIYTRLNYARSDNDITHVFVQSYVAPLPFGKNRRWFHDGAGKSLLGGWQLNGVVTAQGGLPLNFTYNATTLNAPGNVNRPSINGPIKTLGGLGSGAYWFDVSNFSAPAAATFGNLGRNILSGPDLVNVDFSVFRKFALTERFELEFRFESLNFFNTPHFDRPITDLTTPNFGRVTTALVGVTNGDQRQNQFMLKIKF